MGGTVEEKETNDNKRTKAKEENKIIRGLKRFREQLEKIREKNPKAFDYIVKFVMVLAFFCNVFAPAILSNVWFVFWGEAMLCALLMVLQWATLKNETCRLINKQREEYERNIDQLFQDYDSEEKEKSKSLEKIIDKTQQQQLAFIAFTHMISHEIKMLSFNLPEISPRLAARSIVQFLKVGIDKVESILNEQYNTSICASIKLSEEKGKLKTYVRGEHNIACRGGQLATSAREIEVDVTKNYAYDAIINHDLTYFAEGNLLNIHNKMKDDDVFYCEYNDFTSLFYATFIMPIRIPRYEKKDCHECLGLICIDCKKEIKEWNNPSFNKMIGYHLVADYADNLALILNKMRGVVI